MIEIKPSALGYFEILVKPNSKQTIITGFDSDKKLYKMDVAEKAENGKANTEIIKFFKKEYKLTVNIKSGLTSHKKLIRILKTT